MKIFIDTANIEKIREAAAIGLIDGVTTNPSLVAKEGRDFKAVVKEISQIVDGPISAEVLSDKANEMVAEAAEINKWGSNIVIKLPMTKEGLKAAKQLSAKKIKTNVTLVFSANQALLAAKAGATYVSPFVGRLDDAGNNGMQVIAEIMQIYKNYGFGTQVIVASVRHPIHVVEAAKLGAHVATIPPEVIDKMFSHPLTDKGLAAFASDWKKAQDAQKK
ncbi:MAG: fructose-6-phosphate aldolase [Candidatus Micrarchaeia archaeon]